MLHLVAHLCDRLGCGYKPFIGSGWPFHVGYHGLLVFRCWFAHYHTLFHSHKIYSAPSLFHLGLQNENHEHDHHEGKDYPRTTNCAQDVRNFDNCLLRTRILRDCVRHESTKNGWERMVPWHKNQQKCWYWLRFVQGSGTGARLACDQLHGKSQKHK